MEHGKKTRELAANLAAFFLGLLICLAMVDLYVRFFMPEMSILVNYHDRHVFALVPNAATLGVDPDLDPNHKIEVKINSLGFKDREFSRQKNTTRIMVYGDSFIQGSPNLSNTFPKKLQKALSERTGEEVQAINAGVVGYGPDQVAARMQTELDEYQPDLVVVGIFAGNDFGDNVRNRIYRVGPGGDAVWNNFTISPMRKLRREIAGAFPSAQLYWSLLDRFSDSATNASADWGRVIASNIAECDELRLHNATEVVSPFNDPIDMDMVLHPKSDCTLYKKRLMGAVLGEIKKEAAERNVPLLVIVIPPIYEVDDRAYYSAEYDAVRGHDRLFLSSAAADEAREEGIDFLSLYPYFVEENRARPVYLEEGHWNVHGQEYAAIIAADRIVAEGLLRHGEE